MQLKKDADLMISLLYLAPNLYFDYAIFKHGTQPDHQHLLFHWNQPFPCFHPTSAMPYAVAPLVLALNVCSVHLYVSFYCETVPVFQHFLQIITILFLAEIILMTPILSSAETNGSPRKA